MRNLRTRVWVLAAALAGLATAADLNVGPSGGSTVTAAFKQEGAEVESPFKRFSGHISMMRTGCFSPWITRWIPSRWHATPGHKR